MAYVAKVYQYRAGEHLDVHRVSYRYFFPITYSVLNHTHSSIASAMCAPGVPDMMAEFHSDDKILSSFIVTIFVLGYAIGPV